ncbi:MAG: transposase [Ignavibacteriales bacterium]
MNPKILDLYTDYLISSFSYTTATGLSRLTDGKVSHDKITRFLREEDLGSRQLWKAVKPLVRNIESPDGCLIVDDSIEEKPYTDLSEIVQWHYDHSKGRSVKGICLVNVLYCSEDGAVALPVSYEIVKKDKIIKDKDGMDKAVSTVSKNELYRRQLQRLNKVLKFKYVLNDLWYASAENMMFVKRELNKDFVMGLKSNRHVYLSIHDKIKDNYVEVSNIKLKKSDTMKIYLEGVDFPLLLIRRVFHNEDTTTGILYLVTSNLTLSSSEIYEIYQKRWKIEEYHKSIKQNASLEMSPTKTVRTQCNHIFASILAFIKLQILKVNKKMNHFAIKSQIYLQAIKSAYQEYRRMSDLIKNYNFA